MTSNVSQQLLKPPHQLAPLETEASSRKHEKTIDISSFTVTNLESHAEIVSLQCPSDSQASVQYIAHKELSIIVYLISMLFKNNIVVFSLCYSSVVQSHWSNCTQWAPRPLQD